MLRPVSFGLLFCIYTGAMVCVCVHVSKDAGRKKKKWEKDSEAWNVYANINKGYWMGMWACSGPSGQPQHFRMTNCPTNRMRRVEPSVGGLLSYNQSLSVGLSLPLWATVASGNREWGMEGGKKGWEGLAAQWEPLPLGLNRQMQTEWARRQKAESHLLVFYVSFLVLQFAAISRNVNTPFLENIIKWWRSEDDIISFPFVEAGGNSLPGLLQSLKICTSKSLELTKSWMHQSWLNYCWTKGTISSCAVQCEWQSHRTRALSWAIPGLWPGCSFLNVLKHDVFTSQITNT